jgi:hypothetical protein
VGRESVRVATWDDVRRYALALPGTFEEASFGTPSWKVRTGKSKGKGFVWDRPLRKNELQALGDAAPAGPILGVRVPDLDMKEALLARDTNVYFTTPHFDGYPAVLVQLKHIKLKELRDLILEAWLATAPEKTIESFLATRH